MKHIVVRFINDADLVSRLIDWTTDSLWCHTEALSGDGQSWIGAHAGSGVQARALDYCRPEREARYAIPVEDSAYDSAMAWLDAKIGTAYNYADIVGLALRTRVGASDHQVICSALMTEFLQQAGLQPLNCLEGFAYLITPETLHLSPIFIGRRIYYAVSALDSWRVGSSADRSLLRPGAAAAVPNSKPQTATPPGLDELHRMAARHIQGALAVEIERIIRGGR